MKIFKNETKELLKEISKFTDNIAKKEEGTLLNGSDLEVVANNFLTISKNDITISFFNYDVKISKTFNTNHYISLKDETITIKLTHKELKEILSNDFEVILNKNLKSFNIDTPRKTWEIERFFMICL